MVAVAELVMQDTTYQDTAALQWRRQGNSDVIHLHNDIHVAVVVVVVASAMVVKS